MKYKENIIKWNLEKYNCTIENYNKYQIQLFMENANIHLVSTFKDYLFYDDFTEFFFNFYSKKESFCLLIPLFEYYQKSSYIFPNYTVLYEGKYIYKNIIRKQLLIDYLEDIELKKKKNLFVLKGKQFINKKNEKIFDTQLYNNIIMNKNNSKINLLFGINTIPNSKSITKRNSKNNSRKYIENDSITTLKRLIKVINDSYTKSVGTNTDNDITFKKKKLKKVQKRKISPKETSGSTNYMSNASNINANSMFKLDKKLYINNYNVNITNFFNNRHATSNNLEKNNITSDNSNLNYFTQKILKTNKKLYKIKTHKKMNSFLINFNSSFMKSFMNRIKRKNIISDKNVFNTIKPKNRNMNINIKSISNNSKKKNVLTSIEKINRHISICSSISKETHINTYLTLLPNIEHYSRINLKYKKIKIINNKAKKNKLSNHSSTKSKFDLRLLENKNKRVLINTNHNHQRNTKINIEYNSILNNLKKNSESASLNNSIYKTINISNIKKSTIPLTQYSKDKKISLCNELFKNEINYLPKKKFCSKNISKIKITHLNNEEEKKKNSAKIITSYFNSRLPSPKKYKGNILIKKHFNILNKSKNKTLIKAYKTLNNSKYFSKRNSHVIFIKNKK